MRVSSNSAYIPFMSNLNTLQEEKYKNQIRIATGKQNLSLADNPKAMIDIKKATTRIDTNESYLDLNGKVLDELRAVDESVNNISDKINKLRDLAVDGSKTGNIGHLHSIGVNIKGIMEDLVKEANSEFNGNYLFSGSKTSAASLTKNHPADDDMPFQLIQSDKTKANPSGLQIVFKGNMEKRIINKDSANTEEINSKADEMFGAKGEELFKDVIDLYNKFAHNDKGGVRSKTDFFNKTDIATIDNIQKKLADHNENILQAGSRNGSKMNRLTATNSLLQEENTRLKAFRSQDDDADIADATIKLKREEMSLQYSLQIGASISKYSLLDFIR